MHVQVDVDQPARGEPCALPVVGARRMAARGDLRVDRLEAPGDGVPRELGRGRRHGAGEPAAQRVVPDQPLELRGEDVGVGGREEQPAVLDDLRVDGQLARERDRARAQRADEQPRRRRLAGGRGHDDVGGGEHVALRAGDHRDAIGEPAAQRRRARARAAVSTVARQSSPAGEPPQRAQEQPQRLAVLVVDERDVQRAVAADGRARRRRVGAGAHHPVVGGERALHPQAGRVERGGARVEPAEEPLDEAARDLGRDDALGGRVERPHVERPRLAQRDRGGARRERLVDVDEVERRASEHVLERARDVERRRRGGTAPRGRERQQLADAEHLHLAVGREELAPARISRRDSRTSSGERDGASTTIRCPRPASRRASDRTKSPTSCSSSQGWGETCAMANGALTSGEA